MISNHEFIKTQAFEIAWAVFRCAELFSQDKLRSEIEAAAVELSSNFGVLDKAQGDELPYIEKLTAIVRLAESVGQIAPVNARVLYRELDNLTKAIRLSIAEQEGRRNITDSLERMFTNSAYASQMGNTAEQNSEIKQPIEQAEVRQFGNIDTLLSVASKPVQQEDEKISSAAPVPADPLAQFIQKSSAMPNSPVQTTGSAIINSAKPAVSQQTTSVRQTQSAPAGSWQYVILQKVKELGQTTTKELTANYPEISERTIRFYLQKLVDNGSIDRIGSSGPGAAYKAK